MAQTASQVVPDSYAPIVQQPGGPIVIPADLPSNAPEGAEGLFATLGGLDIQGATPDPMVLAELRSQLVGQRVEVAEIFAVARALERAYAANGEALTRVILPAQNLEDGATLKLIIVRGGIETVNTDAVPAAMAGKVAAYLKPLVGRPGVTIGEIERKLLLVADLPGLALQSTLLPGTEPGMSILAVEGVHRPIGLSAGFDNRLSGGLGHESLSLGIDLNGIAGLGETVYLRASGDPSSDFFGDTPRNRALAGGLVVPIGNDGLSLNVEAVDAKTSPVTLINQPGFASHFQRLSARISYPFILSRSLRLTGSASFDAAREDIDIVDPALLSVSRDRLRVARIDGSLTAVLPGNGQVAAMAQLSQGLDIAGARTAADATPLLPLSRAGADAEFTSLRVNARLDQPLARHLAARVQLSAQTSFGDPLLNSESFGIANGNAVSTLAQGSLQGDSGYAIRTELQSPLRVPDLAIAPYFFGAYGRVTLQQPSVFEQRNTDAWGFGAGVRLAGGDQLGWGINAEYGVGEADGLSGSTDRFSLTIQMTY